MRVDINAHMSAPVHNQISKTHVIHIIQRLQHDVGASVHKRVGIGGPDLRV